MGVASRARRTVDKDVFELSKRHSLMAYPIRRELGTERGDGEMTLIQAMAPTRTQLSSGSADEELPRGDPTTEEHEVGTIDGLQDVPVDAIDGPLLRSFVAPDPLTAAEIASQLSDARARLGDAGQEMITAITRFLPRWWKQAVEETVAADPPRTIACAAALPDLKIGVLQLRAQAPQLVQLTVEAVLPAIDDDTAIIQFGHLLSGTNPSEIIEGPLRILLGAVAGQLHRAGLISPGGKHPFSVHADVWRYRFGIELGEIYEVLGQYDLQIHELQDLLQLRTEAAEAATKAQAIELWARA